MFNFESMKKEYRRMEQENKLLKEEIEELKKSIESSYFTLISLRTITNKEIEILEDIEEI